ncbi:PDR/VanB family oxidoreductase [Pseudomonas corrugata]|uniref:PDR/VanB family oxidoreductase n=1 Tax=Pseudomonas corrugata TaxID=47879 RepID=UPI0004640A06|nr:PDR/VanB family oxidoreductase [Pseudomonas corrugata]
MIEVVVTSKRREAEGIFSLELAAIDRRPLPAFSAGSHIDVHLPNGLVRQYSLCNHPAENHRYLLGVLLDPASRGGSKAMHEQVQEGCRLRISEPRNLFPLQPAAGGSVLFAGGIGITPILCMAERLAQIGAAFELHYCARSTDRMAFIEYIRHSTFADRVHVHVDDGEDSQRLDAVRVLSMPATDRHLYVCGPNGFMEHVLGTARALGWAEAQLHREYFAGAAVPTSEAGGFEVQLASSGRCLQVPAHHSVAQVLLEAGIDIPLSCEQGICGTCITRVLEGEPEHRDMFLTDAERARNDQFTPCCSRARSARLVLDL